ncbi:MAG: hypothetical protein HY098_01600 [Nitrospinae bacterium]|nr:hypothetical protein [Nitrospinota bacterium]
MSNPVFKCLLAAVAAVMLLASAPAFAADQATLPKKKGTKAVEKSGWKLDLDLLVPSDSMTPVMVGVGAQRRVWKGLDLRLEVADGVRNTVTFIPMFAGGRYEFLKRKEFALFGEGGVELNYGVLNSQSASKLGLGLGGGADYNFSNQFYATGSVRFHTSTLAVYVNNTKYAATSPASILIGLGYRF